jgi:hypothetical protein
MTLFANEGISKKNLYGLCRYDNWNFKPKFLHIFYFDWVRSSFSSIVY